MNRHDRELVGLAVFATISLAIAGILLWWGLAPLHHENHWHPAHFQTVFPVQQNRSQYVRSM